MKPYHFFSKNEFYEKKQIQENFTDAQNFFFCQNCLKLTNIEEFPAVKLERFPASVLKGLSSTTQNKNTIYF